MPAYRKRRNHLPYRAHTRRAKGKACEFCAFDKTADQVVDSTKYFWVVKNLFPYDLWDSTPVTDHLMVIPKRHVDSIGHFTEAEGKDFYKTVGAYDQKGYSVYARAPSNVIKSVPHQHTHLIAINNRPARFMLFTHKPYFLFTK